MPKTTQRAGDPFYLTESEDVVTAQKVFTRMGERLELSAGSLGQSVAMDAIALESVTWQDRTEMRERAAELTWPTSASDAGAADGADERTEPVTISSEFALAEVTKVTDDGRERLRIRAPKLGYEIELGARELAWLTTQDHRTFTQWLRTPFGPDADDHDH